MGRGEPLVTVFSICYNQKKYIGDALEGFVGQRTNFPFEVRVADDCSTDGTAAIVRRYARRYPDIIKPVFRKKNLGVSVNGELLWDTIKSRYAASCEGDDFWTDPLKLQKQFDFLEARPDYAICFHPVRIVYEDGSRPEAVMPAPEQRLSANRLNFQTLLDINPMLTCSIMYRWVGRRGGGLKYSDFMPRDIITGDWLINLMHASTGKVGFIDEVMAVYRRHPEGIWWQKDKTGFYAEHGIKLINLLAHFEKLFSVSRSRQLAVKAREVVEAMLERQRFDRLRQVADRYPDLAARAVESALPGLLRSLPPEGETARALWEHFPAECRRALSRDDQAVLARIRAISSPTVVNGSIS